MIRVDILDRSPVLLSGMKAIFAERGIKVVAARTNSTQEASWLADVYLVDPQAVAEPDPAAFAAKIEQMAPVIILTGDEPWFDECPYTDVGVHGFVNRNSESEHFIAAVKHVASGGILVPAPELAADPSGPGAQLALSRREEQVLTQIAHGLTHSQVATKLGIRRHTVDTYVKRIRSKTGAGNKAELTRAAILARFSNPPKDNIARHPGLLSQDIRATTLRGLPEQGRIR